MNLGGTPLLVTALVAVAVTAVLIAAGWEYRGRWRWVLRLFSVLTALLSVVVALLVQLNRMTEAYPTVIEVQARPAPASEVANAQPTSQLLTLTVAGPASGLTMTVYAYLPAAYRTGKQRFPVIEAFHGYPGAPTAWFKKLQVQTQLDTEIAAGRMAPTVVLFPSQTPDQLLDTECTNLRDGPQTETFLTVDVLAYAKANLRILDDARWGLIGFSAGGYCATSLALRHPTRFAAAASLSGLAGPGIVVGDGEEDTLHNVAWRLQNLPPPPVALWMGWGKDEKNASRDSSLVARVARPPVTVTTAVVAQGGHSYAVWRQMEGPAFDWLSAHLARPQP